MGIPAMCAAALIAGACEIIKTVVDNVFTYFCQTHKQAIKQH
ncbi:unnamed protein product [Tenebrio molitor]|nr:unnamed protein product [Tenebrio molitor]